MTIFLVRRGVRVQIKRGSAAKIVIAFKKALADHQTPRKKRPASEQSSTKAGLLKRRRV